MGANFMLGQGPRPSVEEYLTRMSPPVAGSSRPSDPLPQTLDEALARRREAEDEAQKASLAAADSVRERRREFWAVIDDFLGRSPQPGHTLTHMTFHTTSSRLTGRTRSRSEVVPLGEGWWIQSDMGTQPYDDMVKNTAWLHKATFLLATGDLVTGLTVDLWHEYSPVHRPSKYVVEIGDGRDGFSRIAHHGNLQEIWASKAAVSLAEYL
jgi:hypothetical protein